MADDQVKIDEALQVLKEADAARLAAAELGGTTPPQPLVVQHLRTRGLTDDQFEAFLKTVQEDALLKRAQEEIAQRQKAKQAGQRDYDNNIKEELKAQVKRVRACDGTNPASVREFLGEIELSKPYLNEDQVAIVKLCARLVQGGLKKSFESFMSGQANRDTVTWNAVKKHIRAAFLSADEGEHLKTALERVSQTAYEGNTAYTRRFREAMDDAYPEEERTAGDERVMLNTYMKGLRDAKIVERVVQETRPTTFQEARLGVERFTADTERFSRFGWAPVQAAAVPEPMEVDSVGAIQKVGEDPPVNTEGFTVDRFVKALGIETLSKQLKGVQSELSKVKLMVANQSGMPKGSNSPTSTPTNPSQPRPNPNTPRKETRTCYNCHKVGHLARACRAPRSSQKN